MDGWMDAGLSLHSSCHEAGAPLGGVPTLKPSPPLRKLFSITSTYHPLRHPLLSGRDFWDACPHQSHTVRRLLPFFSHPLMSPALCQLSLEQMAAAQFCQHGKMAEQHAKQAAAGLPNTTALSRSRRIICAESGKHVNGRPG